jgi:hypothetical protein
MMAFCSLIAICAVVLTHLPGAAMQEPTTIFRGHAILVADSLYHHGEDDFRPFPSVVGFKQPQDDSLRVELNDTKGRTVYTKHFGPTKAGNYVLGFANADTSGLFFVHMLSGRNRATRTIMLRREWQPSLRNLPCPEAMVSQIDGSWLSEYSEERIPQIVLQAESQKETYMVHHAVQLNLTKGSYEVIWQRISNGRKEENRFDGCYAVSNDTLRLFRGGTNGLWHEVEYKCSEDTLTLEHKPGVVNKESGLMSFPLQPSPYAMSLRLVGRYERVKTR